MTITTEICPLFEMMKLDNTECLYYDCAWFMDRHKLGTCAVLMKAVKLDDIEAGERKKEVK